MLSVCFVKNTPPAGKKGLTGQGEFGKINESPSGG